MMLRLPAVCRVPVLLFAAVIAGCGGTDADVRPDGVTSAPGTSRLSGLLGGDDDDGFPRAYEPIPFVFPADHGPHTEFRNEWWYITGNLDSERGRRFGFEMTMFRFSLDPSSPVTDSGWRTNQVYIGHFAVTDVANDRFHVAERYSRGAAGLAGAQSSPFRVWLEDWQLEGSGSAEHEMPWRLTASSEDLELALELSALKPPVKNGDDGLSQKSARPGNASYYYSMPRLSAQGRLRIGEDRHSVSGLAWLDREWSSSALDDTQQGWDWFALQFDDQTELMYYQLRDVGGGVSRYSAGTFIHADGSRTALSADDVTLVVTDDWTNPLGDRYPGEWIMNIEPLGLSVEIKPVIDDQELDTTVRYWEGAVDVAGRRDGAATAGRGYVELTGYSE